MRVKAAAKNSQAREHIHVYSALLGGSETMGVGNDNLQPPKELDSATYMKLCMLGVSYHALDICHLICLCLFLKMQVRSK